jgi:hypothetical protein
VDEGFGRLFEKVGDAVPLKGGGFFIGLCGIVGTVAAMDKSCGDVQIACEEAGESLLTRDVPAWWVEMPGPAGGVIGSGIGLVIVLVAAFLIQLFTLIQDPRARRAAAPPSRPSSAPQRQPESGRSPSPPQRLGSAPIGPSAPPRRAPRARPSSATRPPAPVTQAFELTSTGDSMRCRSCGSDVPRARRCRRCGAEL